MKRRAILNCARAATIALACAATLQALGANAPVRAAAPNGFTEEIIITATRYPGSALKLAGNTARVGSARIDLLNPTHVYEIGSQIPGTWLSRGSGQEHLTAIRSPVLTGAGSCGSFLFLEDGIATRPTGFCNVNELFEIPTEQAAAIEVIRGPASALYGSNALHGTLNAILPSPGVPAFEFSGEAGPDQFFRGKALWSTGDGDGATSEWLGAVLVDRDDGFRQDADYRQAKAFVKHARRFGDGELELGLSGNVLDQETAGFVIGRNAYKDETLRRTNDNPESYRDANSLRLTARWQPTSSRVDDGWDVRSWLRWSEMDFLQHFLPGQPVEENGQTSGGFTVLRYTTLGRASVTAGFDTEVARGWLEEVQTSAETGTPPRPQGKHYDYDVMQYLASPYAQAELPLDRNWTLVGGMRLEWVRYDYDNRMIAGNTRDDGTACQPSCLFNRPADRTDDFTNFSPNIGLLRRMGDSASVYASLTRGYRAPQAAELYRLQSGQTAADLDAESMDSLELGWRWHASHLQMSTAVFAMRKNDYILQDSNRFNVSSGESEHVGAELGLEARTDAGLYGSLAASWAKQTYGFDKVIAGGETIIDGNDIDTSPRTLGSLRIGWNADRWLTEAEWLHQGRYYLTAGEAQRYAGHDLLNLRTLLRVTPEWTVTFRLNNVTDELYADRADFAFGNYRYFPGRDRELFVEVAFKSL